MTRPITIIIPTYNRPRLIKRAVRSALAAAGDICSVMVIDDKSNTAEAALTDHRDDPRLTVLTNAGDKGAAGARNFGVAQSKSEIILFLDDDDELIADYPPRILKAAQLGDAVFGFCATKSTSDQELSAKRRFRNLVAGTIPSDILIGHKLPALSYGIWIRSDVFNTLGGLRTDLKVDEDSDFFFRLYGHGFAAWFESEPGVTIHTGYDVDPESQGQLTRTTDTLVEAQCHEKTYRGNQHLFEKRSEDRWFLIARVLRHAARFRVDTVAQSVIQDLQPVSWRIRAYIYWRVKRLKKARK